MSAGANRQSERTATFGKAAMSEKTAALANDATRNSREAPISREAPNTRNPQDPRTHNNSDNSAKRDLNGTSGWRWTIGLFIFVAFLLGCNEFIVVGITSDIAHGYGVTLSQVGILVTAFAATYVIATPLIVSLTNRFDRYWVLMISVIIFTAANVLTALAPNLAFLFVARVLTACVAGVIVSLLLVFGNIVAPAADRPMVVALVYAGYNIASIVGVPLGTALAGRTSWQACFWIVAVLSLVTIAFLAYVVPRGTTTTRTPFASQFHLLRDRRVIFGCLTIVLTCMSMYAFYTYIHPILMQVLGYTAAEMEILLAVLGVTSIIGNFGAGWVSKQFGVRSIAILEAICAVSAALLAPTSRIGWIGVILLCILCLILVMPSVVLQAMFLAIAVRDYPQAVNLSSTLDPLCCNIGVTFGSLFASLMIRSLPLRNLGYLSALFAVLACVSAFILTRSVARLNRKS